MNVVLVEDYNVLTAIAILIKSTILKVYPSMQRY